MRVLRNLSMEFSDTKMEKEYSSIQERYVFRDFAVTVGFLIILNLLIGVPGIISKTWPDFYISVGSIVFLAVIFILNKHLKPLIHYLTLIVIFSYNLSRLFLLHYHYDQSTPASMFLSGYSVASMQIILINRITKMSFKFFGMLITLAIRLSVVYGLIDHSTVNPTTAIRQVLVDCFIIYIFYNAEKTSRRVFRSYYENREELLKFKELIAENLPQSITILDCSTLGHLFSNNTFKNTFELQGGSEPSSPYTTDNLKSTQLNPDFIKMNFDLLQIDKVSLREIGIYEQPNSIIGGTTTFQLKDILEKLVKTRLANNQTISLGASCCVQEQRKAFDIIIKKVKWDSTDAVAVILSDITYQEKLISLKMANVNKDRVIATVSHELRTPLNGIIGLLDIAEKRIVDPETKDYLSLCKDNAYLLLSLVNSILDLQQISAGKLKLNLTKVDLTKVLNGIVKLFQFQCHQKGIYIESTVSEGVPAYILTDENRLRQILINLIGNAIKFTSKGGVRVQIVEDLEEPDRLQVSIVDTGIGIKESDKQNLFKMYGRLEDGESVNRNGVGLGLTISDALASLLNGKPEERGIDILSKYGEGSTFYFHILKYLKRTSQSPLRLSGKFGELPKSKEMKRLFKIKSIENDSDSKQELRAAYSDDNTEKSSDTNFDIVVGNEFYEEIDTPVLKSKLESYKSIRTISSPDINFKPHNPSKFTSISNEQSPAHANSQQKKSQFLAFAHKNFVSDVDLLRPQEHKPRLTVFPTTNHIVQKSCIVIVDDNPFNLLIATNLVKDFGYSVKTALGGKEAIETVKDCTKQGQPLKAILMDCQMPVMDGFETTRTLIGMMQKEEIPKTPILGWTANNSAEDIKRCYESGMVQHLAKPVSQENLLKALSQLE